MFGCVLQQGFCAKSILVLLYFNFVNNPGLFWIGVLSYNYPNKMLIISVTPSSIETNEGVMPSTSATVARTTRQSVSKDVYC